VTQTQFTTGKSTNRGRGGGNLSFIKKKKGGVARIKCGKQVLAKGSGGSPNKGQKKVEKLYSGKEKRNAHEKA